MNYPPPSPEKYSPPSRRPEQVPGRLLHLHQDVWEAEHGGQDVDDEVAGEDLEVLPEAVADEPDVQRERHVEDDDEAVEGGTLRDQNSCRETLQKVKKHYFPP